MILEFVMWTMIQSLYYHYLNSIVYTDKIHLVADTLSELHDFAKKIGLKRSYYHGVRKGHPHYDLLGKKKVIAVENGAIVISSKELLLISKSLIFKCQLEISMHAKCNKQCDNCKNYYKL